MISSNIKKLFIITTRTYTSNFIKLSKTTKNSNGYNYFSTISSSSTINTTTTTNKTINNINEFSFKVEKEIKQGDLLVSNGGGSEKNIKQSILYYQNGLQLTKDRIERALIHIRIASVKFRLGLISECNDELNISLNLLPIGHVELFKIHCLKSIIYEKEFDDRNDPESITCQKLLTRAIDSWKLVIESNPNAPDGYCGIARCNLKSLDPNLPDCFNYSDKALMCDRTHAPSLLLASEMLVIQNKHSIASLLLKLFFKYYKQFYSLHSNFYSLKPKELADAYFRNGLVNLYLENYPMAITQFSESISIININLSEQTSSKNQTDINLINGLLEKQKNEFENNYNYSNLTNYKELNESNQQSTTTSLIEQQQLKFNYNQCSILDLISNHYFRGKSLMFIEKYNEAINDFNYVIENQPSQIKAFKERAECYKLLNDFISYQNDIKIYNDHMDSIKKRRQDHFNNYIDDRKNRNRKEYLQNFNENYNDEIDQDDSDDENYTDEDYYNSERDFDGQEEDYTEDESFDEDDYNSRFRRKY